MALWALDDARPRKRRATLLHVLKIHKFGVFHLLLQRIGRPDKYKTDEMSTCGVQSFRKEEETSSMAFTRPPLLWRLRCLEFQRQGPKVKEIMSSSSELGKRPGDRHIGNVLYQQYFSPFTEEFIPFSQRKTTSKNAPCKSDVGPSRGPVKTELFAQRARFTRLELKTTRPKNLARAKPFRAVRQAMVGAVDDPFRDGRTKREGMLWNT